MVKVRCRRCIGFVRCGCGFVLLEPGQERVEFVHQTAQLLAKCLGVRVEGLAEVCTTGIVERKSRCTPTDLRPALRRNIVEKHRKNAHIVIHDKTARFLLDFIAEPFDFLLTVLRVQITVGNAGRS